MRENPYQLPGNLDDLLDRALAGYTQAAPRMGMEKRLQARLAAEISAHQRMVFSRPWIWAVASPFAVAAVLLTVLMRPHTPATRQTLAEVASNSATVAAAGGPQAGDEIHSVRQSAADRRKAQGFAIRQPTQQQLIAQLLANGPEAIASLAKASEEQDKPVNIQPLAHDPLVIEPIKIEPIEDNPAESGDSN